jgi:hypothetical protein
VARADPPRAPGGALAESSAATAGYSGTPLHRKLGIAPGHRVLVWQPPDRFPAAGLSLDGAATVQTRPTGRPTSGGYDVVLLFCPDLASMNRRLPGAMTRTAPGGRCWVAWPKRASGVSTDLTENEVRAAGLVAGWVDVKVCAVDATWSGLCLVRRSVRRKEDE